VPRRRASAQDYQQAYREYDDNYAGEDRRRSSGPWIAALVLFIAAAVAVAAWYYFYYLKPGGVAVSGQVPVIAAPDKPAKAEPEPAQPGTSGSGAQGALDNPSERRKQIYDRVTTEQPTEGTKIVPTEEQPQQVEPAGGGSQEPTQGVQASPGQQGNAAPGTDSQSTDPMPLLLPPPPGSSADQQGSIAPSALSQVAALNGASPANAAQPVAQPVSSDNGIAPLPPGAPSGAAKTTAARAANDGETTNSDAAPISRVANPVEQPQDAVAPVDPSPAKQADVAPERETKPVKPAKTLKQKVKAARAEAKKKGVPSEPVEAANAPAPEPVPAPEQTQMPAPAQDQALPDHVPSSNPVPQKKSGAFFDFLNRGSGTSKPRLSGKRDDQIEVSSPGLNAASKPAAETQPATVQDEPQVASIAPDTQANPAPAPAEPKGQAGGYLAQLASFRSEAEALAEYDRLRAKYGGVVGGLSPKVTKASVSGTTRYRLGVGPVASREAAARICNSLIAAGERDCLVRGN